MKKPSAVKTSLFAAEEREQKLDRKGDLLSVLEKHVSFAALAAEVDRIAPRAESTQGGRPPYPTELMVRVLVLQHLYKLSDEAMEYQLLDRLSFQRFCGLRHSASIPDEKTLWVFRERIREAGGADALFNAVQQQLQQQGFIARGGQIIDATLVEAPRQHLHKDDKAIVAQDATPANWTPAQRRQKDTDASWTKKHSKSHHGYKLSISADRQHKFIRKRHVSTAKEHDTKHFEQVLDRTNTSRDVWADKGYEDRQREQRLNAAGWRPHIQRKAKPGKPQSDCQKKRNTRIARPRARVEHVFGAMSAMGGKFIRTIGLARAEFGLSIKAAVYNLQRLCTLKEAGIVPI
ncbi:MAG: IS5 family transposase [Candidatus Thiothrix singaporensis]|uniref:IS5 family transposase n=1 Tax=Candidatus Thiothrix singaporensis TaxID=2799669 RepID=A0A7L6AQV4_9GAMM|nr:MAG: IS5 family transposase [Candidatus Thiothrix singaporensis]